MKDRESYRREGYLNENYHYFHLRDTAGQERSYHFHEFDKLVLLLEGRVDYVVENVTYALKPWTVLLVPHHAIHRALIDRSEPYERIILYLDGGFFERTLPAAGLNDCFESADRTRQYLLLPDGEQKKELAAVLFNSDSFFLGPSVGATVAIPLSKTNVGQNIYIDYAYRFTNKWRGNHLIGIKVSL